VVAGGPGSRQPWRKLHARPERKDPAASCPAKQARSVNATNYFHGDPDPGRNKPGEVRGKRAPANTGESWNPVSRQGQSGTSGRRSVRGKRYHSVMGRESGSGCQRRSGDQQGRDRRAVDVAGRHPVPERELGAAGQGIG